MGKTKKAYPQGRYRIRVPGEPKPNVKYVIYLEYNWNKNAIRKSTNISVTLDQWNKDGNRGRGELRKSFGSEYVRMNAILLNNLERTDAKIAEYNAKHPGQVTVEVIQDILSDKPVMRKDSGKDFIEFVLERLDSEYQRNKIGHSRWENGRSAMKVFAEFLRSTGKGTSKPDSIFIGDLSVELLDAYIKYRREIKQNSDATINHSLTPIIKASAFAMELGLIDPALNARIKDMRIVEKASLNEEEKEFDGKALSRTELCALTDYYTKCKEPRRREFLEMFFFAFHACGLRVIDVMTLQWAHINFEKKEIRKIMIKTNQRHVVPLSQQALEILYKWKGKRPNSRYVFDLVNDDLNLDDDEELYKARNNATRCINQSLQVVGIQLKFKFPLSMHIARHTFAVQALNNGLSMSVVSRLLGHSSTDITEKVYAHFLPETLSVELARIQPFISDFLTIN